MFLRRLLSPRSRPPRRCAPLPLPARASETVRAPCDSRPLFTIDHVGRTMIVTIVEPDMAADRASDILTELSQRLHALDCRVALVVDLQNVDCIDSASLYTLVHVLQCVQRAGGSIALASPKHRVQGIFRLTRLDNVFPIKPGVIEAIRAVESPPPRRRAV